jgi:hypothetical protein
VTDWLEKYAAANYVITDDFRQFLVEEDSADAIGVLHKTVIPGLVQTPEYARAIMEEYQSAGNVSTFAVQLRMERQERLRGVTPYMVVTPGALRRHVGTYATWRDQLLTIKTHPTLYVVSPEVADSLTHIDSFTLLSTGDKMSYWTEHDGMVRHDDLRLVEDRSELLDELIASAYGINLADIIDGILEETDEY